MREHSAFGATGCAGRIHDDRNIVWSNADAFDYRLLCSIEREPAYRISNRHKTNDRSDILAQAINHGPMLFIDDKRMSAGVLDDHRKLGAGQAKVERYERGADPGGREHGEKNTG